MHRFRHTIYHQHFCFCLKTTWLMIVEMATRAIIIQRHRRSGRLDRASKHRLASANPRLICFVVCIVLCATNVTLMPLDPNLPSPNTSGSTTSVIDPSTITAPVAQLTLPVLFTDQLTAHSTKLVTSALPHCIFAYGTLKTGEVNHHVMRDGISTGSVKFAGKATTVERYPLVLSPHHNIPLLLYRPREGERVHGELYLVSDQFRAVLDEFEPHPQAYQRYPIRVERLFTTNVTGQDETHDDNKAILGQVPLRCYAYMVFDYAPHLLDLKTYDNYPHLTAARDPGEHWYEDEKLKEANV